MKRPKVRHFKVEEEAQAFQLDLARKKIGSSLSYCVKYEQ